MCSGIPCLCRSSRRALATRTGKGWPCKSAQSSASAFQSLLVVVHHVANELVIRKLPIMFIERSASPIILTTVNLVVLVANLHRRKCPIAAFENIPYTDSLTPSSYLPSQGCKETHRCFELHWRLEEQQEVKAEHAHHLKHHLCSCRLVAVNHAVDQHEGKLKEETIKQSNRDTSRSRIVLCTRRILVVTQCNI